MLLRTQDHTPFTQLSLSEMHAILELKAVSFRRDALNSELHAEWLSENLAKRQVGGAGGSAGQVLRTQNPGLGGLSNIPATAGA